MTRRALVLALVALIVGPALTAAQAGGTNRAGVVVRFDNGDIERRCVAFDEDEIDGDELLRQSGLQQQVEQSSLGTAVCKIGEDGCSSDDCFCKFPVFWGYWTRGPRQTDWTFSDVGSSERKVRHGTVDGWSWGKDGKPAPPKVSFDDVCGSGAATMQTTSRDDATSAPVAASDAEPASNTNYLAFVAFLAVFAVAAGAAYVLRRRR